MADDREDFEEFREVTKLTRERAQDRQRAIALAKDIAGREARITAPESPRGYAGRVLEVTEHHVVQRDAARSDAIVVHERRALNGNTATLSGKEVEIRYPYGSAGIVREDLTEVDRRLIGLEREVRDRIDQTLSREGRDGDGERTAALSARAKAFEEARIRVEGAAKLGARVQAAELSRFETAALRERDYAVRQGDTAHAGLQEERARAFSEARDVVVELGRDGRDRGQEGREQIRAELQAGDRERDRG